MPYIVLQESFMIHIPCQRKRGTLTSLTSLRYSDKVCYTPTRVCECRAVCCHRGCVGQDTIHNNVASNKIKSKGYHT